MNRITKAALASLLLGAPLLTGCGPEVVHHEEKTSPRLLGGTVHEESTTYKNPDGTYSTEKSKTKTP